MLNKRHRLPGNKITRVYERGRFWRGNGVNIKSLETKLPYLRVAIVVPKKVDRRATERNYIRRRLSETLKDLVVNFSPQDMVISVTQKKDIEILTKEVARWFAS